MSDPSCKLLDWLFSLFKPYLGEEIRREHANP